MPIDLRLTAIPAPADAPLASFFTTAASGAEGAEDIAVAVQGASTAGLDSYLGGPAADVLAACEATGAAGDTAVTVAHVDGAARRVVFLGLGDGSEPDMRKAGAALGRQLSAGRRVLVSAAREQPAGRVRAFAEGLLLGSYQFSLASGPEPGLGPDGPPGEVRMLVGDGESHLAAVAQARTIADAVALARDLVNMPSARKTPAWLAEQAALAAAASGLSVRIWEPDELAAEGFGGLLAVG